MIRYFSLACTFTIALAGSVNSQTVLESTPFWEANFGRLCATGMIWRDCDNDGVLDVFFSNGNDVFAAPNHIFLSPSAGIDPVPDWVSGECFFSGHCTVGDVNDDGWVDMYVSNFAFQVAGGYSRPGDLYLNAGGLPSNVADWHTPEALLSFACEFGDVDNDGDLDLAIGTGFSWISEYYPDMVLRNDNGVFSPVPVWVSPDSTSAIDVTWGDVDNDGDLDLALCYDTKPTEIYLNDGGVLESAPNWSSTFMDAGNTLVFGDINNDGWLDLVVSGNLYSFERQRGKYYAYYNTGYGFLHDTAGWSSYDHGYSSALALGDVDNDGDLDLATGRWYDGIRLYENEGGSLTTMPVWSSDVYLQSPRGTSFTSEELAWVDLDRLGLIGRADTFETTGGRKLFYARNTPLYDLDSVMVGERRLGHAEYCYQPVSGWVSLQDVPTDAVVLCYRYSIHNDLVSCNFDTSSMAFANTNLPVVDMFASRQLGAAPLQVDFSDSSLGTILSREWEFTNGGVSTEPGPSVIFESPGIYDVSLSISTPDFVATRTEPGMILVHADTLHIEKVKVAGEKARIDVALVNHVPMESLILPLYYVGPMDPVLDSISVAGMRTEEFGIAAIVANHTALNRAIVYLAADGTPELGPGDGPILSLYFSIPAGTGTPGLFNPVGFEGFSGFNLKAGTARGDFAPATVEGSMLTPCCLERVGDADGSGEDEPDLGDVSAIVEMLFRGGEPVACMAEADINQSGGVSPDRDDLTIGDIALLVDYLFIGNVTGLPDCY